MTDWWTIGIAAYAAIVSTGALFLELRRWFEAGPRLNIHIMPEAEIFNIPGTENNTYLLATVTNRGNAPTTITHFVLIDYGTSFNRLRSKPIWTAIVPDPDPHPRARQMSQLLQPGERWSGMALHDEELKRRMETGYLYVLIYARPHRQGHQEEGSSVGQASAGDQSVTWCRHWQPPIRSQ